MTIKNLKYFDEVIFKFNSPKDITNVFNHKQQIFLKQNNIQLNNLRV